MHDDNWYQPSASPPETWSASPKAAPRVRPASWLIFGVFSILWGLGGVACVPFGTFLELIPREGLDEGNVNALMNGITQHGGAYRTSVIVVAALEFFASTLLAAGGVGLVTSQDWGYWLARVYAIFSLVLAFASIALNISLLVIPVTKSVPVQHKGYAVGATSVVIFGAFVGAIYPSILLLAVSPPRSSRKSRPVDDGADPWPPVRDFS
jgi:hypothetical protein